MKITAKTIEFFRDDEETYGTKAAVEHFINDVTADLQGKFRYQSLDFVSDEKNRGTKIEIALSDVQWEMAAKLLKDIGVTGIKTKYKKT